ncbi:MAG: hypothetical protein IJ583_15930, partial [Firmicutes bacterium]|nr:hypothetical protein [Bacillota bacterium]
MDELKNLTINADIDEIFAINNKEIAPPKEYSDVVVMGDNKSNSLFFKINRYIDGVDLLGKTFQIFYVNADNYSDIVPVDKIIENDDCIIFSWKLDSNVTHSAGKVQFIVRISSANYVWKSKPSSIDVVETLDDTINPNNYESTWAEETERRLAALESSGAGSSGGNNDMLTSMINGYSERE